MKDRKSSLRGLKVQLSIGPRCKGGANSRKRITIYSASAHNFQQVYKYTYETLTLKNMQAGQ